MFNGTEISSQTHYTLIESIESNNNWLFKNQHQDLNFTFSEVVYRLVGEQISLATELISGKMFILAKKKDLKSAGNINATGLVPRWGAVKFIRQPEPVWLSFYSNVIAMTFFEKASDVKQTYL